MLVDLHGLGVPQSNHAFTSYDEPNMTMQENQDKSSHGQHLRLCVLLSVHLSPRVSPWRMSCDQNACGH